jgi:hypothetical protein
MNEYKVYKKKIFFGIFLIIFSFFGYLNTYNISNRAHLEVSAAFFPRIIFLGLTIFSIILILVNYKNYQLKKGISQNKKCNIKKDIHFKLLFLSLLNCLAYGFLLNKIGFIVISILFLTLQMTIMTEKINIKLIIKYFCLSIFTVGVLYYLFTNIFYVPLP